MTTPRRIIALSTYPIHPKATGGQQRAYGLAAGLADRHGHQVHVVSTTVHDHLVGHHQLSDRLTETVVRLSPRHARAEAELRLTSGALSITDIAVSLLWPATPDLTRTITQVGEATDLVWLVQPYGAPLAAALLPDRPVIYDAHNHETSMKAAMYPDGEGGDWMRRQVDAVETQAVRASQLVTTTTDVDRSRVLTDPLVPSSRVAVLPNGVDTSEPAPTDRTAARTRLQERLGLPASTRCVALFVGSSHQPNVDAAQRIIRAARHQPDIEFVLVGEHCERLRRPHRRPNVHPLGRVGTDVLRLLEQGADLSLNPIQTGGGSNIKVLSSLAAGLPVVTSEVGARGLDVDASGVVVAEVTDLTRVLPKVTGANGVQRGRQGRAYVEASHDWRHLADRLAELIDTNVPQP